MTFLQTRQFVALLSLQVRVLASELPSLKYLVMVADPIFTTTKMSELAYACSFCSLFVPCTEPQEPKIKNLSDAWKHSSCHKMDAYKSVSTYKKMCLCGHPHKKKTR